jgi:hypothetical protein
MPKGSKYVRRLISLLHYAPPTCRASAIWMFTGPGSCDQALYYRLDKRSFKLKRSSLKADRVGPRILTFVTSILSSTTSFRPEKNLLRVVGTWRGNKASHVSLRNVPVVCPFSRHLTTKDARAENPHNQRKMGGVSPGSATEQLLTSLCGKMLTLGF